MIDAVHSERIGQHFFSKMRIPVKLFQITILHSLKHILTKNVIFGLSP